MHQTCNTCPDLSGNTNEDNMAIPYDLKKQIIYI